MVGVDPVTGVSRDLQSADITQSADNAATQATSLTNNAATNLTSRGNAAAADLRMRDLDERRARDAGLSREQQARESQAQRDLQLRGQNLTDSRARERMAFDKNSATQNAAGGGYSNKPLPASARKMQNDALDVIGTSCNINTLLTGIANQISDGKLSFGPVSNLINTARNKAGISTEQSRNLSSFRSSLERLRNESLRLNTGVQTDGDAQRAWNELFENINDTDLVKQRLADIKKINARGVELQKLKVDGIRGNYNAAPYDFDKLSGPALVPKANTPKPASPEDAQAREWATKNPNDPRAKQIMQRLGGG